MGLWGFKKVIHPVRTTKRSAKRALTPKPLRKVTRAATTVRHPASSLEGAAKASVSRTVSRSAPRRKSSGAGGVWALLGTIVVVGLAVIALVSPGVVVMMLVTGRYFEWTLNNDFWQAAAIATVWWLLLLGAFGRGAKGFAAVILTASVIATVAAFATASPSSANRDASASSTGSSALSSSSQSILATGGCRFYLRGHNVRVTVTGEGSCEAFGRKLSRWTRRRWRPIEHPADDALSRVCKLARGSAQVVMRDSGLHIYGTNACRALRRQGFSTA